MGSHDVEKVKSWELSNLKRKLTLKPADIRRLTTRKQKQDDDNKERSARLVETTHEPANQIKIKGFA